MAENPVRPKREKRGKDQGGSCSNSLKKREGPASLQLTLKKRRGERKRISGDHTKKEIQIRLLLHTGDT